VSRLFKKALAASLVIIMCFSLLAVAPEARAASYGWAIEGALPNEMSSFVSAELPDGRIFVAFGYDSDIGKRTNSTFIIDPEGWTWTKMSDAPYGLESPTGAYLDGRIYVFGGINTTGGYLDSVLIYDLDTDVWSVSQDLLYKGTFMRCLAVDSENILLVGGNTWDAFATNESYLFNIDTEIFTEVSSLPEARGAGGMVMMGGLVYYFGGWDDDYVVQDEIFAYDIAGDSWELVGHLPVARTSMGAVAASNGLIYLLGGGQSISWYDSENVNEVLAWDPVSGLFSNFPSMIDPLRYPAVLQLDSRIVYFGGHDGGDGNPSIYSMETLKIEAELSSDTVEQGDSTWVHVWAETEMEVEDRLYGYVYLTKDNVTYGSYYLESAGGDGVMLEVPISEDLPAGEYQLEFLYVTIDYWSLDFKMAPLALTVVDAPTLDEQLDELNDQNQALQDRLDALEQQNDDLANDLSELKEANDAKLDAMIGYAILIVAIGALIVGVIILVRKK